ncbi:MAG: ABC transporter permease [Gemmatimonadales bacterium]|nr:ABC transporter permease [Gemmatimonadales bacterium]
MPLFEAVRLALHALWTQKLKSFFSLIGVLIGVTFLIAVVSIVQGMNVYMTDQFTRLVGLNSFQVRRFPGIQTGNVTEEQWREWRRRPLLSEDDAEFLMASIRTPVLTSRNCQGRAILMLGSRQAPDIAITAADASVFRIKNYDIVNGRAFTDQEVRVGAHVTVIGDLVAEQLFEGRDPVGRSVTMQGIPYRVVGVVDKQGTTFGMSLDKFAIVPFTTHAQRWTCPHNAVRQLEVQAADQVTMRAAIDEVETLLRARRGLGPTEENNFDFQTADGALEGWNKIAAILFAALPGLVAISLVVGGIVIMNIMLMAVAERTKEIGLRKALGAKRRDIMAQFIVESATLATVGAIFGVVLGIGLAFLVKRLSPLPAAVAPWSIGVGVFLGVAVGMAAGILPASRASKLDPIEALRAE